MGCASSAPVDNRAFKTGKQSTADKASHERRNRNVETVALGLHSLELDTTASGKNSGWQMPLIWDIKGARPSSISQSFIDSPERGTPTFSGSRPFDSERTLRRSMTERGSASSGRNLQHQRSASMRRNQSISEFSVSQQTPPSLTRSRSHTSTSPAVSLASGTALPSPGSHNNINGPCYSIHTRKGMLRQSGRQQVSPGMIQSRSSGSFTDVSRRRFV